MLVLKNKKFYGFYGRFFLFKVLKDKPTLRQARWDLKQIFDIFQYFRAWVLMILKEDDLHYYACFFQTKIYHPNVDEKGQICLPIVSVENWKPATKTEQVIQALVNLVNEPEPDHPLRGDLAEEYTRDKKKFMKNAEEFTKKHGEKRPSD